MSDKDQPKLDPQITRKVDGGLRRLLAMSEADIRKGVRNNKSRIARLRRKQVQMHARMDTDSTTAAEMQNLLLMPHPLWEFVALTRFRLRPIQIRAITRFSGNRQDLEALGLTVHSQAHDIFTIEGTPNELRNLALQPATQVVRLPRLILPTIEGASAQAGIADVHQPRPANPTGYRGQGIMIGVVDSPLDVRHAGFREAAGSHNSRVLYYWVQAPDSGAAPGVTPQGFDNTAFNGLDYGRLYTTVNINAALVNAAGTYGNGANQISKSLSTTRSEHGTHVAGIAAGNGHDGAYNVGVNVGAAPDGTMVHVAINYTEDRLIQALEFIFRAANRHNMPAVINVSLGTNQGPHDGTTLFDQNRDNLLFSFENRSIVFAAGNDNNDNGFTRGTVGASSIAMFTMTSTSMATTTNLLDIWSTGPELEIELRRSAATSGFVPVGGDFSGTVGGNTVTIDRDPEPSSNFRGIRLQIQSTSSAQTWTINLRNPHASDNANYWAWTGVQGQHASVSSPVQDELTISDTGCGISILTVGACQKVLPPNLASGEMITGYSGAGPTMDNRVKPEIVAVGGSGGAEIMSADSMVLNGYVGMMGTSMAAPLVTGLVALMMEERNNAGATVDQDTIKALLIEYANRLNLDLIPTAPGFDVTERNLYGYGRARAIGPIDHHLPPQNVDVWIKTAPDDFGLEPFIGDRYWIAPEIKICPQGTTVETNQLTFGSVYDVTVTVRNLGDNDAVSTDVWLKYTRPYAAPNAWTPAEDTSNTAVHTTITVPALSSAEAHFTWRPDSGEVPPPYPDNHFCVLAEVGHLNDVLTFPAPTGSGGSAWDSNIRGTNNVALRNVNIQ